MCASPDCCVDCPEILALLPIRYHLTPDIKDTLELTAEEPTQSDRGKPTSQEHGPRLQDTVLSLSEQNWFSQPPAIAKLHMKIWTLDLVATICIQVLHSNYFLIHNNAQPQIPPRSPGSRIGRLHKSVNQP